MNDLIKNFQNLVDVDDPYFPCPYGKWLQPKIKSAELNEFEVEYTIREDMCNPHMVLHGGVAAGIMDDVIGLTLFCTTDGARFSSIDINVNFLAAAKVGSTILCSTKILKLGKSLAHLESKITLPDGKIVATAVSKMMRIIKGK